jgi:hypothetical protein
MESDTRRRFARQFLKDYMIETGDRNPQLRAALAYLTAEINKDTVLYREHHGLRPPEPSEFQNDDDVT